MKVILEFNLPEDKEDHKHALKGFEYQLAICDIFEVLRQKRKYDDTLTEDQYKLLEELREKFVDVLNDYEINIL